MNKKHDIAILFAIALTLFLLEITIRIIENDISGNRNHINDIPNIVDQISKDQRPSVLFLGNSLINEAVDVGQLSASLNDTYRLNKITPDGTSIWDWSMIAKNQLFDSNVKLDYLVIGFAWGLLNDETQPNPSRLGGYFAKLSDLSLLIKYGMDEFAQVSEFFIGMTSKLFVNREAVRNKLLDSLVPHYKQFVRAQNQAGAPDDTTQVKQLRAPPEDYKMLNKLIDQLDREGGKLIAIAMPIEAGYEISEELSKLLEKRAYLYMDYRSLFEAETEMYKDGLHLNDKGRHLFTSKLAKIFNPEMSGK
ncbi:MAG: hypothetical protein P8163_05940 [Candidatus Thiodiazotropha sp.]